MAVGRVGGTKSKISGQVGSEVYQIRSNGDGTYTQIVMSKGVRTETQTSPKLQAQRMCMCMVEALMRDIKPVGQISMQSQKTKTASLNALSSWNVQRVMEDSRVNWYGHNKFLYPPRSYKGKTYEELGGLYMLSSGSLEKDLFSDIVMDYFPAVHFSSGFTIHDRFVYLKFDGLRSGMTVDEFLDLHRMTYLDNVVLVAFREWFIWRDGDDESEAFTRHSWLIAKINPDIKGSDILDESTIGRLFVWDADYDVVCVPAVDGKFFGLGIRLKYYDNDETVYFMGGFSISNISGKKKISTSYMRDVEGEGEIYMSGYAPTDVFGTWMGEPRVKHYPSPYE